MKVESELSSLLTMPNASPATNEPLLTDPEEIRLILKNLKNKRSNGADLILNVVLKKLPGSAHGTDSGLEHFVGRRINLRCPIYMTGNLE